MDYQDEMKSVTVRVANGSGIIVKPLADDCFYILTAYHVVEGKTEDQIELDFQPTSPLFGKSVKVRRIINCEKQDSAILIIDRHGENIAPFYPCSIRKDGADHWHAGYPNNQNDNGKANSCKLHYFNRWLGTYGHSFLEYQCPNHITKEELDGMSGGGVFDGRHHIIGVHKQSAAEEIKEELGKNVLIPWLCFKRLIIENNLPRVVMFDLNSFEAFKNGIFSFSDNVGAWNKLKSLLLILAQHKTEILGLSPLKYYEDFQQNRRVNVYKEGVDMLEDDWVRFGEFIVAMKAIWNYDVVNQLDNVFPYFQYVQSEDDFDIYEASQRLDPNILGVVRDTSVIFVIGGIQSKGYKQDVRHKEILDIAVGLKPNSDFDIARTGREALGMFTFVNAHFFKDALEANTDEIRDCEGDKLEFYRYLIKSKI